MRIAMRFLRAIVQPVELRFVMLPCDACAQQSKRKSRLQSRRRHKGRDRKWQRVIVPEINRDPGDEREPKEQIDVRPKDDRIDAAHEMDEMMMVDPIDRDDDETSDISRIRLATFSPMRQALDRAVLLTPGP